MATPSEHNPYHKDLDDMLHDLDILETIDQLTGQLKLKYEVLTSFCEVWKNSINLKIGEF